MQEWGIGGRNEGNVGNWVGMQGIGVGIRGIWMKMRRMGAGMRGIWVGMRGMRRMWGNARNGDGNEWNQSENASNRSEIEKTK